jgi:hypothetical protein
MHRRGHTDVKYRCQMERAADMRWSEQNECAGSHDRMQCAVANTTVHRTWRHRAVDWTDSVLSTSQSGYSATTHRGTLDGVLRVLCGTLDVITNALYANKDAGSAIGIGWLGQVWQIWIWKPPGRWTLAASMRMHNAVVSNALQRRSERAFRPPALTWNAQNRISIMAREQRKGHLRRG